MIQFDPKKINLTLGSPKYFIDYYVLYAPGNIINITETMMNRRKFKKIKNDNKACFAGFRYMVQNLERIMVSQLTAFFSNVTRHTNT